MDPQPPSPFVRQQLRRRHSYILILCLCIAFVLYVLYSSKASNEAPYASADVPIYPCFSDDPVKRVAIIGAGSAGSSAAYYINQFTQGCSRVNITVYERNDYVGGRTTTVNAHDDPEAPIELGGSIFVKVNHNLISATERFGLDTTGFQSSTRKAQDHCLPDTIGVYDGRNWVYWSGTDITGGWWSALKLLWKYGISPIRVRSMTKDTVGKFLKMYSAPIFPFTDLGKAMGDLELLDVISLTGEQHLYANGVSDAFGNDIVQASTRVNYAQNLDTIHGVETMVCMATDGAMSVSGGNWQIFASMLVASGANVKLNTKVTGVSRKPDGTYLVYAVPDRLHDDASLVAGQRPLQSPSKTPSDRQATYDSVIIATPFQFANLSLTPPFQSPINIIPYITLHVTLFSSPYVLHPGAFNLQLFKPLPRTILTTRPPPDSDVVLPFNSISTLRTITSPRTGQLEYVYKIFSLAPLNDTYISSLLATDHNTSQASEAITWQHRKVWQSYPVESPRTTFEDIKVPLEGGGEVWYTSGIESFISTMETSSLMGMNVGRLLVDEWLEGTGATSNKGKYLEHGEEL